MSSQSRDISIEELRAAEDALQGLSADPGAFASFLSMTPEAARSVLDTLRGSAHLDRIVLIYMLAGLHGCSIEGGDGTVVDEAIQAWYSQHAAMAAGR